jgi:hypothetical protein
LRVGDRVSPLIELLGRPVGAAAAITEVGGLFITVRFDDGRVGYYLPSQLQALKGRSEDSGLDGPAG